MSLQSTIINKSFLFLDRDGVINKRPLNDYVKRWEDFHFLPGVLEAFQSFAKHFEKIFIITNQQGVGKGLMTEEDLEHIHTKMKESISDHGGRIDAIFYCTRLKSDPQNCRKPNIQMAHWAKEQFPEVDFSKSVMIGDTLSDMKFAKNVGMLSILLDNEYLNEQEKIECDYLINTINDITKLIK